jgi:hypothetical protein
MYVYVCMYAYINTWEKYAKHILTNFKFWPHWHTCAHTHMHRRTFYLLVCKYTRTNHTDCPSILSTIFIHTCASLHSHVRTNHTDCTHAQIILIAQIILTILSMIATWILAQMRDTHIDIHTYMNTFLHTHINCYIIHIHKHTHTHTHHNNTYIYIYIYLLNLHIGTY